MKPRILFPVNDWDKPEPPERKALDLLVAALDLAQQAIREQHRRLDHVPLDSPPSLPTSELLAEIVVERCAELEHWIERYNDAVDYFLDRESDPF